MKTLEFSMLQGLTMNSVVKISDDRIQFCVSDGRIFELCHSQDCCESVQIESITGDLDDLKNVPILLAEVAESNDTPQGYKHDYGEPESQTWTFYKLRTIKGSVDIRWYGNSNGYYSEAVDFIEVLR